MASFGAQHEKAQIFVFGDTNVTAQYRFLSFYIDETGELPVEFIAGKQAAGLFKSLTHPLIDAGLNPHPLWISFSSRYVGQHFNTYWWNFYTHADSLYVYQQTSDITQWKLIDKLSIHKYIDDRKNKVRFLSVSLSYEPGEEKRLLVKIIHNHNPQHFVTDFSTPKGILLWERDFYWSIGLFLGSGFMVLIYSIIAGIVSGRRMFFIYATYLLSVLLLCLKEEILAPVLPNTAFKLIMRLSSIHLAVICMCFSFYIIAKITDIVDKKSRFYKQLRLVVNTALVWGIISGIIHYGFYEKITVRGQFFIISWYTGVAFIFLVNICISISVLAVARKKTKYLNILVAGLLIYFNPGSYYLNYEGILTYYTITYPNYFYWILLLEYIILGSILSWQYNNSVRREKALADTKAGFEATLYQRELEVEKREREKLAQDLHDDLATSLSTVKLLVSSRYKEDTFLLETINQANIDVREFLEKLSDKNILDRGITFSIEQKIRKLNNLNLIQFHFYNYGDENRIPESDHVELFWIMNELLVNILKHSKAKEATVQLITYEDQYTLMTEDDGIGIREPEISSGFGLNSIKKRVDNINAQLHVCTGPRGTTTIISKKIFL